MLTVLLGIQDKVLRSIQSNGDIPDDALEYTKYIRESIRIFDACSHHVTGLLDPDRFFGLLEEEQARIQGMKDSLKASLSVDIDIKINLMQHADEPVVTCKRLLKLHDNLDVELAQLLAIKASRSDHIVEQPEYLNVASVCRDVRKRMNEHACLAFLRPFSTPGRNVYCVYNLLLLTLETLQRRAYEEIRSSVDAATSGRLPAELCDLVFTNTMAAEDVPIDPRCFVNAEHKR